VTYTELFGPMPPFWIWWSLGATVVGLLFLAVGEWCLRRDPTWTGGSRALLFTLPGSGLLGAGVGYLAVVLFRWCIVLCWQVA
jgi:hypothetical protein